MSTTTGMPPLARARELFAQREFAAVIETLDPHIDGQQDGEGHALLALAYFHHGQYAAAEKEFALAHNQDPTNPEWASAAAAGRGERHGRGRRLCAGPVLLRPGQVVGQGKRAARRAAHNTEAPARCRASMTRCGPQWATGSVWWLRCSWAAPPRSTAAWPDTGTYLDELVSPSVHPGRPHAGVHARATEHA